MRCSLGNSPQGLVVEGLEAPAVPQGGSLAHRLLTEVLPQPAVDQAVQEALEGDGQGLRERGEGSSERCLHLPRAARAAGGDKSPSSGAWEMGFYLL